jgi:tRNA U34 5-methylaminomethyl-2-thiouridine-forming methyltransferase MnmC
MTENSSFYDRQLVHTGDGSHSIYLPQHDEFYHSSHGALRESLHVFIKHGLEFHLVNNPGKPIAVFEMGFGTALNALLTWQFAREKKCTVQYTSLEAFPVTPEMAASLNYIDRLNAPADATLFEQLHTCAWNMPVLLAPFFELQKHNTSLEVFVPGELYHVVFYDAFAPRVQPELWTAAVFEKLYAMLETGGVLVTYCAKGEVKRHLKAAGFRVETLPGPPGKREMTRAHK